MSQTLSITILMDNAATKDGLDAEHGFALWIEVQERRILFDTGQSERFIDNAQKLGIDIRQADTLILSHGHYDHTGGLAAFINKNKTCDVYCHSGVFIPRYSRQPDGDIKPIGINGTSAEALHSIIDKIHWVSTPVFLSGDIGISGPIPRVCSCEDTGGDFYLDPDATRSDWIYDDMALWVNTSKGLVLITGCCHSGVINTIDHVCRTSGQQIVHGIIGGFHLLHASGRRLTKTVEKLSMLSPRHIVACHCTGDQATQFLAAHGSGDTVRKGEVGMTITI